MKDLILKSYSFQLLYAGKLVDDVNEDQMAVSPAGGLENHPAFTLGHLVSAAALTSKYLGGPFELDPEWERLFRRKGPGDPILPEPDTALYPKKEELVAELTRQHALVEGLILGLEESRFGEEAKWRFDIYMPTLGDLLHFMCISHECMHLGQLAAWRRAMGMPSALGRL